MTGKVIRFNCRNVVFVKYIIKNKFLTKIVVEKTAATVIDSCGPVWVEYDIIKLPFCEFCTYGLSFQTFVLFRSRKCLISQLTSLVLKNLFSVFRKPNLFVELERPCYIIARSISVEFIQFSFWKKKIVYRS